MSLIYKTTRKTKIKIKSASPWTIAFQEMQQSKMAMISLYTILFMIFFCLIVPWFSPYNLDTMDLTLRYKPPSMQHWLGTDSLGRDVFLRLMLAGRISLQVGLISSVVGLLLGSTIGAIAGFYRGWVDSLFMRISDILMSIPSFPLLLILGSLLSEWKVAPNLRIYYVMFLLGFISWPSLARIVRSQILSLREQEFMQATESLGLRDRRRIFRHLLPNTFPTVIVIATLSISSNIIGESGLSYLGLGVIPPNPSWGNMIAAANNLIDFTHRPWLWIPPGICIFIVVISFNVFGDALRDALDPNSKMKG